MELKRCPFCGGEADVWWEAGRGKWSDRFFYKVKCNMCGVEGKAFAFFHDGDLSGTNEEWNNNAYRSAVAFWNSRHE